jgi:hypothetical protein
MDNYVIIDREFIEKRIGELEEQRSKLEIDDIDGFNSISSMIGGLKFSLSQSVPLIPEIVRSFNSGERYGWDAVDGIENIDRMKEIIPLKSLEDYISNLNF